MSILRKTEIPLAITGIVVIIVLLDLFSGIPAISDLSSTLQAWSIIMAGFALGIGAINLIWRHGKDIANRGPKWFTSAIIFFFIAVVTATGLADLNLQNPIFRFTLDNIYSTLYGGVWAFEGFFGVYGYYRAFKVRNAESFVMLIASVVVTLKNAPLGEAVLGPSFTALGNWIINVPNVAGIRALTISVGLGTLILALRSLLGKETGYLRR